MAALLIGAAGICFPAGAAKAEISVSAESAVLLSADSGDILFEKDCHTRRSMASTTKIMTALLAVEAAQRMGDPVVSVTEEMVAVEGSSMGLRAGDEISLQNLAAGMLLASGNDAANAVALYLGETQEGFAELMNRRAEKIGMKNTHFVTPSGLDDDQHYSTAYDMALLAREALQNDSFVALCSSETYQVVFQEPAKTVPYTNHNKMLWQYEGCIGMKTGFTKKSGRCLVSAAQRDGVRVIAVTLSAPDDWNDHTAMLDRGFSMLTGVSLDGTSVRGAVAVAGGTADMVKVRGTGGGTLSVLRGDAENITSEICLPTFVYAPVKPGDVVGRIRYCLKGTELYSIPIVAEEEAGVLKQQEDGILQRIFGWGK